MTLGGGFISLWIAGSPHPGLCWAERWYRAPSLFSRWGDAQVDGGGPPAGVTHRGTGRMLRRELGLIYSKTLKEKKKKEIIKRKEKKPHPQSQLSPGPMSPPLPPATPLPPACPLPPSPILGHQGNPPVPSADPWWGRWAAARPCLRPLSCPSSLRPAAPRHRPAAGGGKTGKTPPSARLRK